MSVGIARDVAVLDPQLDALLGARTALVGRIEQRAVELLRDWLLANDRTWLAVDFTRSRPEPPFDVDELAGVIANLPRQVFGSGLDVRGSFIARLAQLNGYLGRSHDDHERVDLAVAKPRLEVVIVRDHDGGTDGRIWLDGRQLQWATDYEEYVIDAGAGHLYTDWIQARDSAVEAASPAAAAAIEAAYNDPPGYQYVEGAPEGWPCGSDENAA